MEHCQPCRARPYGSARQHINTLFDKWWPKLPPTIPASTSHTHIYWANSIWATASMKEQLCTYEAYCSFNTCCCSYATGSINILAQYIYIHYTHVTNALHFLFLEMFSIATILLIIVCFSYLLPSLKDVLLHAELHGIENGADSVDFITHCLHRFLFHTISHWKRLLNRGRNICHHLTRAPVWVLDFHALVWGVFDPPLLTRLLGHVVIRERRRPKERQK